MLAIIVWIVVGILALTLLVLGLLFEPVSILRMLALPFIVVRDTTEEFRAFVQAASERCKSFFLGHASQITKEDKEGGPAFWFVSRFVYMLVATFLIVATAVLDIYRANSAQYQGQGGSADLPGFLATLTPTLLNGLIWSTLIAFWGIITLDVFELIPPHARLLQVKSEQLKVLRWIVGVGAVSLCLTVGMLYYVASLETHGGGWADMGDYISGFQGALINFAIFLALLALVYGLVVILMLCAGILWGVFSLLDIVLSAVDKVTSAAAEIIMRGATIGSNALKSGYNSTIGQSSGTAALPPIPMGDDVTASTMPLGGTSKRRRRGRQDGEFPPYRDPDDDHVVNATTDTGQTMMLGIGKEAIDLLHWTLADLQRLQLTSLIRAAGISPIGSRGESVREIDFGLLGVRDISAHPGRLNEAQARRDSIDGQRSLMTLELLRNAQDAAYQDNRVRGQILLFMTLDNVALASDAIAQLRANVQDYVIGVVAIQPEYPNTKQATDRALEILRDWREWGYISTAILLDPQSPLARNVGPKQQALLMSKALASMIAAPSNDPNNATIGKVLDYIGQIAPYAVCGLETTPVSSGAQATGWWLLNSLSRAPRRGAGNPNAIRAQSFRLIDKLFGETSSWSIIIDPPPQRSAQVISVITSPIRTSDRRWSEYRDQMTSSLRSSAAHMKTLFVSGNGTPENETVMRDYYVQVSMLSALAVVEADSYGVLRGRPAAFRPVEREFDEVTENVYRPGGRQAY